MKKPILIFLIDLCLYLTAFGQYNFQYLDSRTGLNDNRVNSIAMDGRGFIWIGTPSGLTRWDGYATRAYSPTGSGLSSDNVNEVLADGSGNVWVKCHDRIAVFDQTGDSISSDVAPVLAKAGIKGDVSDVWTGADGKLWLLDAWRQRLYSSDPGEKVLTAFDTKGVGKVAQTVSWNDLAFCLSDKGELYQISPQGLVRTKCGEVYGRIDRIHLDSGRRLWVVSADSRRLDCINADTGRPLKTALGPEFGNDIIRALANDGKGNLWVATNSEGVFVLSAAFEVTRNLKKEEGPIQTLPGNHVSWLYRDPKGVMWIGMSKSGIAFTPVSHNLFEVVSLPLQEDVACFVEGRDGDLWIGTDGRGLMRFRRGESRPTVYNAINSSMPSSLVIGGFPDKDGKIYFGTYGGGVFTFKDERFTPLALPDSLMRSGELKFVRHIAKTPDGTLWLGTFEHGLFSMDPDSRWRRFNRGNSGLRTDCITGISVAGDSTVFVGTSTGVYRLNPAQGTVVPLKGLHDVSAKCLYFDSRGLLWVGTNEGLVAVMPDRDDVFRLTTGDHMSNNIIKAVTEDSHGCIWVSTQDGLTKISVAKGENGYDFRCFPYYGSEGLGNLNFHSYAIGRMGNGDIYAGSTGCFVKIHPVRPDSRQSARSIEFTGLEIEGKNVGIGEKWDGKHMILDKDVSLVDEISLPDGINAFSLRLSALDYVNRHKIKYEWSIDDREWSLGEGGVIRLENLESGVHELKVRAMFPDSALPSEKSLRIRIPKPFYKTPLFIMLLSAALAVCATAFVLMRKLRTRGKQLDYIVPEVEVPKEASQKDSLLRRVEEICQEKAFDIDFSVEGLAQELGMSRSGLYKKLMQYTGKSPIEYLRLMRLKKGKTMLEKTDKTVSEIAYSVGLSPKQFSRFFKVEFGCLPTDYRARSHDRTSDGPVSS